MVQTTGYPELDAIGQRLERVPGLDARELEAEEIAVLGRKAGALTALLKRVAELPIEERKRYGALVNRLKGQFEAAFAERREAVAADRRRQEDAGRDLTMPARGRWVGAEHPVTRVVDEIVEIFRGIGFTVAVGPEVETDWYNFLALNFPPDHPAMDMHDTLYLDAPPVEGEPSGRLLLRTHTSPVQIRTLLASPPPVRVVIPGMVYRNDAFDASHSPAFSQIEGLAVDEGISFVDLKATLIHFAHRFFSPSTRTRFRPSFFPFTEPSAEMDVECQICHGSGCPACKGTGWMEILGCGMVHPKVLENVSLDPERYTGWAFGMGPHRIAMLRYGLPDIRLLLEGDMRFLEQTGHGSAGAQGRGEGDVNVSVRWLEAFLRRSLDPRDVADRLTMLGAPVDAVEAVNPGLEQLVVARVLEVSAHPNPKFTKVRMTVVDDGTGEPKVVACGAANVTPGRLYPFAPVGTRVPGGKQGPIDIGARAIGGVTSHGMLCSTAELGLGDDSEGIWELETDAAPGTPLMEAIPLADHRLVVDVTPNRPDLLGHKGIARELAASYGAPFRLPVIPGAERVDVPPSRRATTSGAVGGVTITIEDTEGCARFHGALIRGATVAPSPDWLRRRLEAVGVRSINNVVDATNYVMLELNQPMHAYDAATLRGSTLIVRRARSGERVTTLDHEERKLDSEMIAIADGTGVIGLAGVMGGADTEVGDASRDILLEGAYWDPRRIRRTRRALGMSTEASYRFERGIDRWNGAEAMRRCIELIRTTAGGTLADAPLDLWPEPSHPPRIFLRPARVAQVLGVELPWASLEKYLVAIGATVVSKPDDGRIAVDVPGWRPDLVAEIDLIEEIARLHGYEAFPADLRPFRLGSLPDAPIEDAVRAVRQGLVAAGLYEVSSLPLGKSEGDGSVRLVNPLSAEDAWLRRRLLPGLVRLVEANWANHVADVRLFEIGTAFSAGAPGERPREEIRVAGVLTGRREPAHWTGTGAEPLDLWDLKGRFEAAVALAIPGGVVQVERNRWVAMDAEGRAAGEAGPLEADAPPWAAPLYGFEIRLDPALRRPPRFTSLPTTPAVERVLALLLPDGVRQGAVTGVLRRAGGDLLERVQVESDYRGPELPPGTRSVAFRLTFRAADRTLRDADVDQMEARILAALAEELGVHRRDAGAARGGE